MLENELMKALVIRKNGEGNNVSVGYENCNVLNKNMFQTNSRKNYLKNPLVSSIIFELSKDSNSVFHSGFELGDVNIPVYVGLREDDFVEIGLDKTVYQDVCVQKGHSPIGGVPILAEFPILGAGNESFLEKISQLEKNKILTDRVSRIYVS